LEKKAMAYFLGRGKIYIGERGANGEFLAVAEFHCPEFEIDASEIEFLDHDNTSDVIAVRDLHIATKFTPKLALKIDTMTPMLLAMALGGEVTEVENGSSFSAKAFPTIAVGETLPIPGGYSNLDSLTITDSAGSPATLSAGTHYTADLLAGLVAFKNLGSFTQPFKAAGSEADDFSAVSIATVPATEKALRFVGVNIADTSHPRMVADILRASFDATKFMPKSSANEVQTFDFAPQLLADPHSPFNGDFGPYGRVMMADL
jgi:hypothetical protein